MTAPTDPVAGKLTEAQRRFPHSPRLLRAMHRSGLINLMMIEPLLAQIAALKARAHPQPERDNGPE